MDSDWREKYAIEQIRAQRHDFMNYLQVIYGYIQINKTADAAKYIMQINKNMTALSKIFNFECDIFALFLQEFIFECSKIGLETEFNSEVEYISCSKFSKDIEKKKNILDSAFNKFLEEMKKSDKESRVIYLNIIGDPENFKVVIRNSKGLGDGIISEDSELQLKEF
jgi:sensor histidine kinase regulating citrate/malate metabolism